VVLSAQIARVTLERAGLERVLHSFAFRYPFSYGVFAVILAVLVMAIMVLRVRSTVDADIADLDRLRG